MPVCPVCHAEESRKERVDDVFRIDGQYVLVGGIPAAVCIRCGEQAFSRETIEKVRTMIHGEAKAAKDERRPVCTGLSYDTMRAYAKPLAAEKGANPWQTGRKPSWTR